MYTYTSRSQTSTTHTRLLEKGLLRNPSSFFLSFFLSFYSSPRCSFIFLTRFMYLWKLLFGESHHQWCCPIKIRVQSARARARKGTKGNAERKENGDDTRRRLKKNFDAFVDDDAIAHSSYWHFSYACLSSPHFHGRKKLFRRHSFRGINKCAQKSR